MYSAKVEIVKWEKAVEQLENGWQLSRLTIRRMREEGADNPESSLCSAFAEIDGKKILGASINSLDGRDLYICWFNADVDFRVGSICSITWERYMPSFAG